MTRYYDNSFVATITVRRGGEDIACRIISEVDECGTMKIFDLNIFHFASVELCWNV